MDREVDGFSKIHAIKTLRARLSMGLAEAKYAVEHYITEHPDATWRECAEAISGPVLTTTQELAQLRSDNAALRSEVATLRRLLDEAQRELAAREKLWGRER